MKLSNFTSGGGPATSLKHLDNVDSFTIVKVVDSAYDDTPGIRLTTDKKYKVDGENFDEFYTTRKAIVETLSKPELRQGLDNGGRLKVKIGTRMSKNSKPYFILEEV